MLRRNEHIDSKKSIKLVAYRGDTFSTLRMVSFTCTVKGESRELQFHVVNKPVKHLIGLRDSLQMRLVSLDDEVHEIT